MCWIVAALLRIVLGFVIVAVIIIAGVVLSIINVIYVDFVLMVLVIGAGSVIALYVNDFGFWLFKGYFNLTVGETLRIWTVMEIFIFIMGLLGVLVINVVLYWKNKILWCSFGGRLKIFSTLGEVMRNYRIFL